MTTSYTESYIPKDVNADCVAEALEASITSYMTFDEIMLPRARFENGRSAYGQHVSTNMRDWVANREAAASSPWPRDDKDGLPAEVGAILNDSDGRGVRRRGVDVSAFTWIFVDSDTGAKGDVLRQNLDALQVCYLMAESATSRWNGNGAKWHLFLPLSKPLELQSLTLHGVDAPSTLRARAAWWQAVNDHVGELLFRLGGLEPKLRDGTSGSFPRIAYVPHKPPGGGVRRVIAKEGGLVDLDKLLAATSWPKARAKVPIVFVDQEIDSGGEAVAASATRTDRLNFDGGDDGGGTVGETTGTLVHRALDYFGLVGPRDPGDGNAYLTLCPWRGSHTPSSRHDPDAHDDSVLVYVKGNMAGETGGFRCMHHGSGTDGECDRAGAADVLRWARANGCPLPDRPEFGGRAREAEVAAEAAGEAERVDAGAVDAESAPPTPTASSPPRLVATVSQLRKHDRRPAFPGAPVVGLPPVRPESRYQKSRLPEDRKVTIVMADDNLDQLRDEAMRAVEQHPKYFRVGGVLHDIVVDSPPPGVGDDDSRARRPWLRKTSYSDLKVELCAFARFVTERTTRDGEIVQTPQRPDNDIVKAILAAGDFPRIRPLSGIISSPVFRHDGTLLQHNGYDAASSTMLMTDRQFPLVSANPSRTDLGRALNLLRGLFSDFPLVDPELAFSVLLALLFTRLLRNKVKGWYPCILIGGNTSGGGKTLLARIMAIIADGEEPEIAKGEVAADEGETERVLGMALKKKTAVLVFDNVARGVVFASSVLERFLTGAFSTREIRSSLAIEKTFGGAQPIVIATGNGLQTGGDMVRRCLRVDIYDSSGNPTARRTRIADIIGHCRLQRPELLGAALTLLSGYFAASHGGWKVDLPEYRSFEGWNPVREAVVWCGLPDPFLARAKVEDDSEKSMLQHVVEHVRAAAGDGTVGVGVGAYVEELRRDKASAKPRMRDAFDFFAEAGVVLDASPRGGSVSLGKFLQRFAHDPVRCGDGVMRQLWWKKGKAGSRVGVSAV